MSAPLPEPIAPIKPRPQAAHAHPDPRSIATLAEWIAAAERPLIVTAALHADAVPALERLAERCAIPVVAHGARTMCLPSSHPMHFGFEPGALLTDADLVIVIESDVPWIPHLQHPPGGCRVAHIGEDPFYVRYPMRSFPSDLAVQAGAAQALDALARAVEPRLQMADARIAARRAPTDRAHAHAARAAREGFRARHDDLARISLARDRRSCRQGRDHHQRISAAPRPLRARKARHVFLARARRRARLGPRARRSARSSRRPTNSSSRRSATAPTCSPIRWSATGCRPCTSCRS